MTPKGVDGIKFVFLQENLLNGLSRLSKGVGNRRWIYLAEEVKK
jgi:hypothetical protein